MSGSAWLLPDDGPMGPWLRVEALLKGLPSRDFPLVIFRNEPSENVRTFLGRRGVEFCSLGRKGLNQVACAWRLGKLLRSRDIAKLFIWDVSEVTYALLAIPKNLRVSCELAQGQSKPGLLKWLPAVGRWFRRGLAQGQAQGEIPVPYLYPGTSDEATIQGTSEQNRARILLLADNRQGVRDGLWGFDIFRHAWPGTTLNVVGSADVVDAGRGFAGVLGLGDLVSFGNSWPDREDLRDGYWMVVLLGSGPWLGDACLRARCLGWPVIAQACGPSTALEKLHILEGVVREGDRAGLASTLQAIFQNQLLPGALAKTHPGSPALAGFGLDQVISAYNF